ncbi:DUF4150 domain-containing protein [Azoarcus indigens]|nr:DUF4150 domain-containing protein [Azoarcus indigens]
MPCIHNIQGFAHKSSGGMSMVFPDVCNTPSPGGPIPIPYPNIGKSSDRAAKTASIRPARTPSVAAGAACVSGAPLTKRMRKTRICPRTRRMRILPPISPASPAASPQARQSGGTSNKPCCSHLGSSTTIMPITAGRSS